jgi:ribosomal protein L40E
MTGVVACCCDMQNLQQQQQQQQQVIVDDDDEPKRVCPECGIQNPREASYCGDCGYDFTPSKEREDE